MKITNILNVISGIAFYAIATYAQAQCPQICDTDQLDNTAIGVGAFVNNTSGYL